MTSSTFSRHLIFIFLFTWLLIPYQVTAQTPNDSSGVRGTAVPGDRSVITTIPAPAPSLSERLNSTPYFGLGLQAGFATGVGISLRYTSPQRMAGEVNLGYITAGENRAFYSFGAEFQYQLDNSLDSRLYALSGLGYYADEKANGNALSAPTRLGIGVGYEAYLSRSTAFDVEVPLTFFFGDRITLLPTAQLGFIFYFR